MLHGFYKKTVLERRKSLCDAGFNKLDDLAGPVCSETGLLDKMAENVIGACRLPMGILTGLRINGREHCVAMATEEPSVIAAVNRVAGLLYDTDGIQISCEEPVMTAQIMFVVDPACCAQAVDNMRCDAQRLIETANLSNPGLIAAGGGAFDLLVDALECGMILLSLKVHTRDAMGANAVNTMAEAVQREIVQILAEFPGFERGMAILSNEGSGRMVRAECMIPSDVIERKIGINAGDFMHRIELAGIFADRCPERAITHNKGILNGIIAAALPLGQDTRAMQIAIDDHACKTGKHRPLSQWHCGDRGLTGHLELPLVAGLVGGFRQNPAVEAAFEFDGIHSCSDLCGVLAGVGLAQNLGALWALMTEGIQAGHMRLHQRKLESI